MGRRLALALAVTVTMTAVGAAMVHTLVAALARLNFESSPDLIAATGVQLIALVIGTGYAAWLGLTAAASCIALTLSAIGHASVGLEELIRRTGAPMARRLASVSVASSMLLIPVAGVAPAIAAPDELAPDRILVDLGWDAFHDESFTTTPPSPVPEPSPSPVVAQPEAAQASAATAPVAAPATTGRSVGGGYSGAASAGTPTPAAVTPAGTPATTDSHTVVAGESLWSIAAAHAGPDASPGTISALWPRWYEANQSTIGADPDVIHPGMILHAPTEE